ncbi:hypothetical protein J437_LFUL013637 [Ladona fulva]|uniref:Tetratricopeptide repeat protein 8 n=1 Tax=Ladona fulva TaxID=123851 RepID=A0A8K0KIU3_LADFU|nr:hypothetical protein J437_LFUL013637 [Ladona fulva]
MELAREAAKVCIRGDIGWWEEQIGRCLFLSGRLRDSRVALRTSMGMPPGGDSQPLRHDTSRSEHRTKTLSGVIRLARVDTCLDQPLAAISVCVAALESFPGNVLLLTEIARLYEALGDEEMSVKYYQNVLRNDSVNAEALACVATHHYYQEQPDMALPFYRHLLQLGLGTVEVLCNMALCYLATQQLDVALPYFFKAISLAEASGCQEALSQLWYNASHIALVS